MRMNPDDEHFGQRRSISQQSSKSRLTESIARVRDDSAYDPDLAVPSLDAAINEVPEDFELCAMDLITLGYFLREAFANPTSVNETMLLQAVQYIKTFSLT